MNDPGEATSRARGGSIGSITHAGHQSRRRTTSIERLENAYRLALAPIDVQLELPDAVHGEFLSIRRELERLYFAPDRDAIRDLNDAKKATKLAGRLVSLYDRLIRLHTGTPDRSDPA